MSEFAAFLLASPTRSSYVGFCRSACVEEEVDALNALDDGSPLSIVRPWKLASSVNAGSIERARCMAATIAQASGFRARYAKLNRLAAERRTLPVDAPPLDAAAALDGMTYENITFCSLDGAHSLTVRALVDTGSTDCELRGELIERLKLQPEADTAVFETASGIQTEAQLFRAIVRARGREAMCLLSPSEPADDDDDDDDSGDDDDDLDARFGFDQVSDDAMLGHDALAALGLLVDCRHRRLVPLPLPTTSTTSPAAPSDLT